MARETVQKTILVALALCVVCSLLVSAFAVGLRPLQEKNKAQDMQKNILQAADIYDPALPIEEQFANVEQRVVDLSTGEYVPESEIDPATYDQKAAALDPSRSIQIAADDDLGGIKRRAKNASVYIVKDEAGQVETYVLPVHGKGLWSTLYGMLALEADLTTVKGLIFYEHKETPGLGGEVDNPLWRAKWVGKKAFDEQGDIEIEVLKGSVDPNSPDAQYQVDGLTGATITARGVSNLLNYWLGDGAFGPYIAQQKSGGSGNG